MAVILRREEAEPFPVSQIPVELRKAPRVVVKSNPIVSPPTQQGAKITARTDSHYACAEPNREEFFKGTYKRRSIQLNQCGFHGASSRPYKDLGPVELDDGRLILDGLGQTSNQEQVDKSVEVLSPRHQLPPAHMSSLYRVKLRPKTPSQFPTNLANLKQEVDGGNNRLESIRRGKGLFELMKKHEAQKQFDEVQQTRLKVEEGKNEWKEAEVTSRVSLTRDQEEMIERELLQLQRKHSLEIDDGLLQSVDEHRNLDLSEQTAAFGEELDQPSSPPASFVGESLNTSRRVRPTDLEFLHILDGSTDRRATSNSTSDGKPRPQYSADIENEIERWYRLLCVLVWVLEAMRMESPHYMTPFRKCWSRETLSLDENTGKRVHEANKRSLNQWEKLKREQKALSKFRSKIRASIFVRNISPLRMDESTPTRRHVTAQDLISNSEGPPSTGASRPQTKSAASDGGGRHRNPSRLEEEKMMKQKKLTPFQMENLLTLLEEELNYTKKQSRSRINAIIKQADEARLKSVDRKKAWQLPQISLDVGAVEREFEESEERRRMIAHEQLTAMERDRSKALHQRFSSLKVSGNLWQDLGVMREGVQIETTSMARRKLLMNYEWFPELKSMLPDYVQQTPKCSKLLTTLEEISQYMCEVGPKRMSRRRLIQVLATRKPWELRNPAIADAVEFLTQRVIYIVAEDYVKWLEQHTLATQKTMTTRPGGR